MQANTGITLLGSGSHHLFTVIPTRDRIQKTIVEGPDQVFGQSAQDLHRNDSANKPAASCGIGEDDVKERLTGADGFRHRR